MDKGFACLEDESVKHQSIMLLNRAAPIPYEVYILWRDT